MSIHIHEQLHIMPIVNSVLCIFLDILDSSVYFVYLGTFDGVVLGESFLHPLRSTVVYWASLCVHLRTYVHIWNATPSCDHNMHTLVLFPV